MGYSRFTPIWSLIKLPPCSGYERRATRLLHPASTVLLAYTKLLPLDQNLEEREAWCGRGDLNPHARKHYHLKVACLPIPPPPQAGVHDRPLFLKRKA